tara:strand:- start:433 stop:1254 length:822 start_codon:yes stop_codon:yes gene_type:complete
MAMSYMGTGSSTQAGGSGPSIGGYDEVKPQKKSKKKAAPATSAPSSFMDSITGPPTAQTLAASAAQTAGMGNDDADASAMQAGIASLSNAASATADADMYAENLKRYNDYMESQKQPAPTEITPEMRQAALGMFESQQGAGQMPYYMAAGLDPQATNMSPAFQYAAQNYGTLGGSQRLAPRPMEMMSVAERNRINDMSQAMADQAAQQQMAQNEYQQGMNAMTSGKGNAATMPQQGVPPTQPPMPQYGGGLAAMLAKRFGTMGGSGGSGGFGF